MRAYARDLPARPPAMRDACMHASHVSIASACLEVCLISAVGLLASCYLWRVAGALAGMLLAQLLAQPLAQRPPAQLPAALEPALALAAARWGTACGWARVPWQELAPRAARA